MLKPYSKLRYAMEVADLDRQAICEGLNKSPTYVALRFTRKYSWTIEDAYKILEMIGQPPEMIAEFFPRGGN